MKYINIFLFLTLILSCSQKITTKRVNDLNINILPLFSFNPVGDEPEYTNEYKLIWLKSKETNSEELFINMTESQNAATRLYGLAGLKIIKSTFYSKYYNAILTDNSRVLYSDFGCCYFEYKSFEVANFINDSNLKISFFSKKNAAGDTTHQ